MLSSVGTWAQQVAEPRLLLTLGASPFLIGLDSFAADAPVYRRALHAVASIDRAIDSPPRAGRSRPGTQLDAVHLSRILGPALAGVLMSGIGMVACFAVNAASYVPFIGVALWVLPRRTPADPGAADRQPSHLWDGVRETLRQPRLRGAIATVFTSGVLCAPLITFSPVLVKAMLPEPTNRNRLTGTDY